MNKTERNIVEELNRVEYRKNDRWSSWCTNKLWANCMPSCPKCRSRKVKVLEAARSRMNVSTVSHLLGGLLLILGLIVLEPPTEFGAFSQILWAFGWVLAVVVLIGDKALGIGTMPPFSWFEGDGAKTYRIHALCKTCNEHFSKIIRLIYLENGYFANADHPAGIHQASRDGDAQRVEELLDRGADANAKDKHCRTPLHAASRAGHSNVAALLLKEGADCSLYDGEGKTAMSYAVENGHTDLANLVRQHGAEQSAAPAIEK